MSESEKEVAFRVVLDGVEPTAEGLRPVHVEADVSGTSTVDVRETMFARATEAGVVVDKLVVEPAPVDAQERAD